MSNLSTTCTTACTAEDCLAHIGITPKMYRKECAPKDVPQRTVLRHQDVLTRGRAASRIYRKDYATKDVLHRTDCTGCITNDVPKGTAPHRQQQRMCHRMCRQKDVYCPRMHRKGCAAIDVPQIYCKERANWMLRDVTPQGSFAVDMEAGHKHLPVYPTSYVPMLTAVSPKPIIAKLAGERT